MIRLAIRVRREDAELALAELLQLAPAGVEELEISEQTIEYAVYGAPGELPALPDLKAAAGDALVEVSTTEIPEDWSERWKQFHSPVLIEPVIRAGDIQTVGALHIRPPWSRPTGVRALRRSSSTPAKHLVPAHMPPPACALSFYSS